MSQGRRTTEIQRRRDRICHHVGVKPTVYIETSVVSYQTARLSRDLLVAAYQQVTQE